MNTALIIIGLLLAFVTGFFAAVKSIQIGLKWQMQIKEDKEPTIIDKAPQPTNIPQYNILDEWVNGAKEVIK